MGYTAVIKWICCLVVVFIPVHYSQASPSKEEVAANFIQCIFEQTPIQVNANVPVIKVAVRHAPPFIYEEVNPYNQRSILKGIAVDFWESVAERLGVDFQYVCLNLSDTLVALEDGTIDIAISPLTITKSREQAFDFSHQYFNSGLVFASSPSESNFDFSQAFNTLSNAFKSSNLIYLFLVFSVLLIMLVGLALKNISHYQAMPVMINKSKSEMVLHVVLYSVLNMSGIRKDVFGFSSMGMQLFSVLILVFGITVSASLFSMVTAALTQSVSHEKNFSIDLIDQYHVATLQGSTAENYLSLKKVKSASLAIEETWQAALQQVVDGKKEVVLGDWVQLVYLSQKPQFREKIMVHNQSFQFEPYGWGLKNDFALKDRINQELISLLRNQQSVVIVQQYIGKRQISMQSY